MSEKTYQIAAFACTCGQVHIDVSNRSGETVQVAEIVKVLRDAADFIESNEATVVERGPHRTH